MLPLFATRLRPERHLAWVMRHRIRALTHGLAHRLRHGVICWGLGLHPREGPIDASMGTLPAPEVPGSAGPQGFETSWPQRGPRSS